MSILENGVLYLLLCLLVIVFIRDIPQCLAKASLVYELVFEPLDALKRIIRILVMLLEKS